jgi:chaperonin GroEL
MIVANAGHEGAVVVEKVKSNNNQNYGFNAETEIFGDLVADGVIDPTKVTRAALQNAASIASLLLTTEAMVCEYPEEKDKAPAGPPGGMGGGMY